MGQSSIEKKLQVELAKEINSELQVVYILSRIRKILEIKKIKDKYAILNFYCNWSLHSEMSKTDGKKINAILKEFIENPEEKYKLSFHVQFSKEINDFLNEYSFSPLTGNNLRSFKFMLGQIISDTPIKVMVGTKYKIVFKEPKTPEESGLHITTIDQEI